MWGIAVLNEMGVLIESKVQFTDYQTEYPRGGGGGVTQLKIGIAEKLGGNYLLTILTSSLVTPMVVS